MPKSLQDVLDHADELAAKIERWEPDDAYFEAVDLWHELVGTIKARADAERNIVAVVAKARAAGVSWGAIGTALGVSGEAARKRYGKAQAA